MTAAPVSGVYDIQVVTDDNRRVPIAKCRITGGQGSYGTAIDLPVHAIHRVELVKSGAPTLAARLS